MAAILHTMRVRVGQEGGGGLGDFSSGPKSFILIWDHHSHFTTLLWKSFLSAQRTPIKTRRSEDGVGGVVSLGRGSADDFCWCSLKEQVNHP